MNAAVLIASRELRDRSRLFLMAACVAFIPFVAALAVKQNRPLAVATTASFLAAAFTSALALALGVSAVGRELTERRLSFLLSKPVSAASIWIGKASAGMLTWLVAFAIILLPTVVSVQSAWKDMWHAGGDAVTAYSLLMGTLLFFGGHVASTMFRSRSALLALDFVLLGAVLLALLAMARPLLIGSGPERTVLLLIIAGVALLGVLVTAPIWQIARGRVDPRGNHAALSTALWGGAAIVLLIAGAYTSWVVLAPLSSLENISDVEQSPSGKWLSVTGEAKHRGYWASFLVDTTSGKGERLNRQQWGSAQFTRDGRTMVWMENEELLPWKFSFRLQTRRLEAGAERRPTPIVVPGTRFGYLLSEDGTRVAVMTARQLEVYEVESGRLLGSATGVSDGSMWTRMFFAGSDRVRVLQLYRGATGAMLRIREFDLTHRKLTTTAEWPWKSITSHVSINVTSDGSRIFVREEGAVHDAHTGAVLFSLPGAAAKGFFSAMLANGAIVAARDGKLSHFDQNGALVAEIPIPVPQARVAAQVGASKVLLSFGGNARGQWRLMVVDLETRKVAAELPGYLSTLSWWDNPVLTHLTEDTTVVARNAKHGFVLWDVRTGAKRPFP